MLDEKQEKAIDEIWSFFQRCTYLMSAEYEGDRTPIHIRDFRMVDYGTKDTKNGKIKTVKAIRDLPFRTIDFFSNHYTDVKNAYKFFNDANRENGIRIITEKYLKPIGRFNTDDFIGEGLISHKVACNSLPWHNQNSNGGYND